MAHAQQITCVFDPNHKIDPHRLARHYARCSTNFPKGTAEICPYNSLHWVLAQNYEQHVRDCPDNHGTELIDPQEMFSDQNSTSESQWQRVEERTHRNRHQDNFDNCEVWDISSDSPTARSYNPMLNAILQARAMNVPPNLRRAEKEEFYKCDKLRIQKLEKNQPLTDKDLRVYKLSKSLRNQLFDMQRESLLELEAASNQKDQCAVVSTSSQVVPPPSQSRRGGTQRQQNVAPLPAELGGDDRTPSHKGTGARPKQKSHGAQAKELRNKRVKELQDKKKKLELDLKKVIDELKDLGITEPPPPNASPAQNQAGSRRNDQNQTADSSRTSISPEFSLVAKSPAASKKNKRQ